MNLAIAIVNRQKLARTIIVLWFGAAFIFVSSLVAEEVVEVLPEPAVEVVEVSDRQLDQAADIYLKIADVYQDLQQELQEVDDEELIRAKLKEAEKTIADVMTEVGLDEDSYVAIMTALEQDEALVEAFVGKLQEKRPMEMQPPPIDPADVTDEDLEQAAQIYLMVQKLNEELQVELAEVEDPAVVQQRIATAELEIMEAAEKIGMDPEKYENVMRTLQYEQALLERFLQLIDN